MQDRDAQYALLLMGIKRLRIMPNEEEINSFTFKVTEILIVAMLEDSTKKLTEAIDILDLHNVIEKSLSVKDSFEKPYFEVDDIKLSMFESADDFCTKLNKNWSKLSVNRKALIKVTHNASMQNKFFVEWDIN